MIYALFLRHFFRLKEAKLKIGYARVSANDHILGAQQGVGDNRLREMIMELRQQFQ